MGGYISRPVDGIAVCLIRVCQRFITANCQLPTANYRVVASAAAVSIYPKALSQIIEPEGKGGVHVREVGAGEHVRDVLYVMCHVLCVMCYVQSACQHLRVVHDHGVGADGVLRPLAESSRH